MMVGGDCPYQRSPHWTIMRRGSGFRIELGESTVTSPIERLLAEDMDEEESSPWWLAGGLAVALFMTGVVVWWVFFSGSGEEPVSEEPVAAVTTTTTLTRVDLVPFETDPLILAMPRTLPRGMGLCADDTATFCDPNDPSRTITITHQDEMLRDTSSAGSRGIRRLPSDDLTMAIAFPGSALIFEANGIPPNQLVAIISSVPLASNDSINVPDEPQLNELLERDFIAEHLGISEALVKDRGQGNWGVNTKDITFTYIPIDAFSGGSVEGIGGFRESAARLQDPVSVSEDRTLVVGFDPRLGEVGQYVAQWIQRKTMWFLRMDESIVSADEFLDRIVDLESAIAEHL